MYYYHKMSTKLREILFNTNLDDNAKLDQIRKLYSSPDSEESPTPNETPKIYPNYLIYDKIDMSDYDKELAKLLKLFEETKDDLPPLEAVSDSDDDSIYCDDDTDDDTDDSTGDNPDSDNLPPLVSISDSDDDNSVADPDSSEEEYILPKGMYIKHLNDGSKMTERYDQETGKLQMRKIESPDYQHTVRYSPSGVPISISGVDQCGFHHGCQKEWYPTGILKSSYHYEHGKRVPGTVNYEYDEHGGRIRMETVLSDNKVRVLKWYPGSNTLAESFELCHGKIQGIYTSYYPSGNRSGYWNYINGMKNGHGIVYTDQEETVIENECIFVDNECVSPIVHHNQDSTIWLDLSTYQPDKCPVTRFVLTNTENDRASPQNTWDDMAALSSYITNGLSNLFN